MQCSNYMNVNVYADSIWFLGVSACLWQKNSLVPEERGVGEGKRLEPDCQFFFSSSFYLETWQSNSMLWT